MDISSNLLAKGAAGALAATAAVGTGVAAKNNDWFGLFDANGETINVENPKGNEQREAIDDSSKETVRSTNPEGEASLSGGGDNVSGHTINPVSEPSQGTVNNVGGSPDTKGEGSSGLGTSLPSNDTNLQTTDRTASETKIELTKFDQGLIDFLGAGGDIVFEVKKGGSGNRSTDFTEADLDLSSANPLPITAKVSIDTSNAANLIEKGDAEDGGKGKITTLQKLNGTDGAGTPWTWTCKVKLKTIDNPPVVDVNGKSIHDKDKIFNSTGIGLFNLLKKNISGENNEEAKQKLRGIKEKFIKSCAKERTDSKETLTGDKLESTIVINLKPGATGQTNKTDENKLYPCGGKDDEKFNELFGEATAQQTT